MLSVEIAAARTKSTIAKTFSFLNVSTSSSSPLSSSPSLPSLPRLRAFTLAFSSSPLSRWVACFFDPPLLSDGVVAFVGDGELLLSAAFLRLLSLCFAFAFLSASSFSFFSFAAFSAAALRFATRAACCFLSRFLRVFSSSWLNPRADVGLVGVGRAEKLSYRQKALVRYLNGLAPSSAIVKPTSLMSALTDLRSKSRGFGHPGGACGDGQHWHWRKVT